MCSSPALYDVRDCECNRLKLGIYQGSSIMQQHSRNERGFWRLTEFILATFGMTSGLREKKTQTQRMQKTRWHLAKNLDPEKNVIWQCVKTQGTPVVHIKIAGLKWMFIPLNMVLINRYWSIPICSMYGIFTNIYPKHCPNVGKYSSNMEHLGYPSRNNRDALVEHVMTMIISMNAVASPRLHVAIPGSPVQRSAFLGAASLIR